MGQLYDKVLKQSQEESDQGIPGDILIKKKILKNKREIKLLLLKWWNRHPYSSN